MILYFGLESVESGGYYRTSEHCCRKALQWYRHFLGFTIDTHAPGHREQCLEKLY